MELVTKRLRVREFTQSDLKAVYEYSSDPEVVRYMPFGPNTKEDAKNFLERAIKRQSEETRTDYELAVTLKKTRELIGGCRINKTSEIEAHIGYIYNKKH